MNKVMNEKIEGFAKQCWSHYIDGTLIDGHLHFDYKKFAELIVRECADELRREWYELNAETIDDSFADPRATGIHIGQKTGAIRCISRIKQHFGVE